MPRPDFIPRRDSAFLPFVTNFAQQVSLDPPALGLSGVDATALQLLVDDFTIALSRALHPETRTRPNVAAKNSARSVLAQRLRELARRIQAYPAVSDGQRIALGLTPRSAAPVPSGRPTTRPLLSLRALTGNRARLRLADDAAHTHRGKPPGTVGAILFYKIGGAMPVAPQEYTYAGMVTTGLHTIHFPAAAASQDIWVTARWFNLRGEEGPPAATVRTTGVR
jgi:hypothetical protein